MFLKYQYWYTLYMFWFIHYKLNSVIGCFSENDKFGFALAEINTDVLYVHSEQFFAGVLTDHTFCKYIKQLVNLYLSVFMILCLLCNVLLY